MRAAKRQIVPHTQMYRYLPLVRVEGVSAWAQCESRALESCVLGEPLGVKLRFRYQCGLSHSFVPIFAIPKT